MVKNNQVKENKQKWQNWPSTCHESPFASFLFHQLKKLPSPNMHIWCCFCLSVPCISLMLLLLLLSGAVSTTAFTLMMRCSQRASPHCRASHYSLLATAEVLGKLTFSVFVGAITDVVGYSTAFGLFLILSIIVLPLFRLAPLSLEGGSDCTVSTSNKNCWCMVCCVCSLFWSSDVEIIMNVCVCLCVCVCACVLIDV